MDRDYLGKEINKLGFGLMRLPMLDKEIDIEHVKKMVDTFMENGFTYFDTAYVYAGGKSETVAKEALVNRYPREAFQLATKLPMWIVNEQADMERYFDEQLSRVGVEYFDFYLLHGISATSSDRFPSSNMTKADKLDAWEFIRRKKAEGKIKHIGFSFHDSADVLDKILSAHTEVEFVQLQINYADWDDEIIQSRKCYETAGKYDVPIIIMEPVKGGTLVSLRPEITDVFKKAHPSASLASWAIRYCASLDGIITVLSDMSNLDQLNDNVVYMKNFKAIDDRERTVIDEAVKRIKEVETIGCTGCRYCVEDCPQKIKIPNIFDISNSYSMYKNMNESFKRYRNAISEAGKASDCIACGSCESHCPQKLEIISHLRKAAGFI